MNYSGALMRLVALTPALAKATGHPERSVAETARQLRITGLVPGYGMAGGGAPHATCHDVATALLALLFGHEPTKAAEAVDRALGLVAKDVSPPAYLAEILEQLLEDLVEYGEPGGGLVDLKLSCSRPWPYARLRMAYVDGAAVKVELHHEEARGTGDASRGGEKKKKNERKKS